MRTIKKELGKVSITCNGRWDPNREYERLCLVHDGMFASYISKTDVPVGISLEDEGYWQPVANLKDDVKADYGGFKAEMLELLAEVQRRLNAARIVVKTVAERDSLTALEVGVGCEVYVLETKQSWILDKLIYSPGSENCTKEWHLEADGKIDSEERYELEGTFDVLTADRAICDAYGNIIHDTYITRQTVHEYVDGVIREFLLEWKYEIKPGTITPDMLSEAVKELLGNGVNITNFPDEEDLTVINEQLKFKDRPYDEEAFSGMGYKILRKNWMGNINLLEQRMINEPNTVYIIRYYYCLDKNTIRIPDNSVLVFCGGSFNNGKVLVNGARIRGVHKLEQMGSAELEAPFSEGQLMFITEKNEECVWKDNKWQYLPHADRIPNPYPLVFTDFPDKEYDGTKRVEIDLDSKFATDAELSSATSSLQGLLNSAKSELESKLNNAKTELNQSITNSQSTLQNQFNSFNGDFGSFKEEIESFKTMIEQFKSEMEGWKGTVDGRTIPNIEVSVSGEGNAITDIAVDGENKHKLNVTKGKIEGSSSTKVDNATHADTADNATNAETANKVAHKLIFTGGSTEEYDGSAEVTVTIPTSTGEPPDMSLYYKIEDADNKFVTKTDIGNLITGGKLTNKLTFAESGGAESPADYDGSASITVSAKTVGAIPADAVKSIQVVGSLPGVQEPGVLYLVFN